MLSRVGLGVQVAVVVASLLGTARPAQREPSQDGVAATVLLRATVIDKSGDPVTNLPKQAFRVFEDRVEQKVQVFRLDSAPLSIGVLVDISRSAGNVGVSLLRQVVQQFSQTAGALDEFFLLEFNDEAYLEVPFTADVNRLRSAVAQHGFSGGSAVHDAIYMAAGYMRKARNPRRALLIISDGEDNASRHTKTDTEELIRRDGIQVYCILLKTLALQSGLSLLRDVSELTGGVSYESNDRKKTLEAATAIGRQMRNQYVLGYSPASRKSGGKPRRLDVRLNLPRGSPRMRVYFGPRLTPPPPQSASSSRP